MTAADWWAVFWAVIATTWARLAVVWMVNGYWRDTVESIRETARKAIH